MPLVEALDGLVEGPLVDVGRRLVRALAQRESSSPPADLGAELDAVGCQALTIGARMMAAEAFAHAAEVHRAVGAVGSAGVVRAAAASARRRDEQIAACGLERLPMVATQGRADVLSEREVELAAFARSGMSNREIAERLTLSVRTVETHLQRVYRKLGVRGRAELADISETLR